MSTTLVGAMTRKFSKIPPWLVQINYIAFRVVWTPAKRGLNFMLMCYKKDRESTIQTIQTIRQNKGERNQ
jgi:hypothetical protein